MRGSGPRQASECVQTLLRRRLATVLVAVMAACSHSTVIFARDTSVGANTSPPQSSSTTNRDGGHASDQHDFAAVVTNVEPEMLLIFGSVLLGLSISLQIIRSRRKKIAET